MRISDWSSDVCSSDLQDAWQLRDGHQDVRCASVRRPLRPGRLQAQQPAVVAVGEDVEEAVGTAADVADALAEAGQQLLLAHDLVAFELQATPVPVGEGAEEEIGRASWRESVCQYG